MDIDALIHSAVPDYGICSCGCGRLCPVGENGRAHHSRKAKRWAEADLGFRSPCHVWLLARTSNGYGLERGPDRRMQYAHRLAYERVHGPIPWRLQIDHLCGNRECVNPDHLEPVTPAENVHRGRGSKLTADDVREIRASDEKQGDLAERFSIGQSHVSRIRGYHVWTDVP